jgi:hypothetical protein
MIIIYLAVQRCCNELSLICVLLQTPPRVITLDEHYFPSADDFPSHTEQPEEQGTMAIMKPKPHFYTEQRMVR